MRVALVTESFLPHIDGVVTTISRLTEHLQHRGHDSILFAPAGGPPEINGTRVIALNTLPFPPYPDYRFVPPVHDLRPELDRFDPDVMHLFSPTSLGLAGIVAARLLGIPTIASYETDVAGFAAVWGLGMLCGPINNYYRWLHNRADLNLCPSHATAADVRALGFRRVAVWPRAVDTERFHPLHRAAPWRDRLSGGHPEAPLLLYAGRVAPEKRIRWIRPVLDAVPEARLAIIGDGPSRANLERLFAGTNTVFTGFLRGQDLSAAYASADIFVFPGPKETFGFVVMEAMASGLPVIAARAGGPLDQITHAVSGLLFEPNDQSSLVEAVASLAHDPGKARRMGRAARLVAESRSWTHVLDGLLEQYAALIGQRKRPRTRSLRRQVQQAARFLLPPLG